MKSERDPAWKIRRLENWKTFVWWAWVLADLGIIVFALSGIGGPPAWAGRIALAIVAPVIVTVYLAGPLYNDLDDAQKRLRR